MEIINNKKEADTALYYLYYYQNEMRENSTRGFNYPPEVLAFNEKVCELLRWTVTSNAAQREADHQRESLKAYGLAEEFPFGCDAIQHVAEALIGQRQKTKQLEAEVLQLRTQIANAKEFLN